MELRTIDNVRHFRDALKTQRDQVEQVSTEDVRENLRTWEAVEKEAGELHGTVMRKVDRAEAEYPEA